MNLLGVHCSIGGGLENAFTEAKNLGINTFQIFTRNQRQWKAKPVSAEEEKKFKETRGKEFPVLFSHTSYLINLGSADDVLWEKSVQALFAEVERCTALGLHYCVLHPGAAGEQSLEVATNRIAEGINMVLKNTEPSKVMILLENTAGQGSSVGGRFENLQLIREKIISDRIGYCFDTCHAFVAGYDIRTHKGFQKTMDEFDNFLGLKNLKAIHLNDSKGDLGSHLDRHENIGKGKLGLEPFKYIMAIFPDIPKVLETPKEDNMDEVNLAILREL